MMRLKVFNILAFCCYLQCVTAQYTLSGKATTADSQPIDKVQIYERQTGQQTITANNGNYTISNLTAGKHQFIAYALGYRVLEINIDIKADTSHNFIFIPLGENLSEVILIAEKEKIFALQHLKKVEGTAIYAAKKTEVVLMDQLVGNTAANNARQIYNQVVGLNIYDSGTAGLQLNIGGRGLDPNRTQNFNTRQNGYDISANVLGYPESYYTPPPEALENIQIIRGAASLQYGTQFGGLVNFKFKAPNPNKKIEIISRQSTGSYNLFTSFNSLSGTLGKFSYYTYYHRKQGKGFRPNSGYQSNNFYVQIGWNPSDKTKIQAEYTYLNYLAQQAGGLTDAQFYKNPNFSNRSRNWFRVNWNLYALKLQHQFSEKINFSLNLFGLSASRVALGYRSNRISENDSSDTPRELLIDDFNNWGAEARLLKRYKLGQQNAVLLLGSKYYQSYNAQQQGAGQTGNKADFRFANEQFPYYVRQTKFSFPNNNLAFFGENIFYINPKWSVTSGFRIEYIKTKSQGSYENIILDLAGQPILNETLNDNRNLERSFILLGIGNSYQIKPQQEIYFNFSQNYRSITYNDIRVTNPVFQLDPNITDEKGFTTDIGIRDLHKSILSYDFSAFGLLYNRRIGEILKAEERLNANNQMQRTGRIIRYRGNIGDAFIYGLETFADWNIKNTFFENRTNYKLNLFSNFALTHSQYISSQENNIQGNQVEFIPLVNLKTGVEFGYKNLLGSFQYTYLSQQYSDASNAEQNKKDNQKGFEGIIPAYDIADISLSYSYKIWKLETGINNLFNTSYFTQRATGYPGPGIIPAQPLTWYVTLGLKL